MALADFKELRRQIPIEQVIGERIRLRRQGRAMVGRCPFHDDKGRPNLTVYPDTQTYVCFVCHARGDVVDFVARIEDLSQGEAAKQLEASWRGSGRGSRLQARVVPAAEARSVEHLDLVYRLLLGALELRDEHRADLERRGLSPEMIHERGYRSLGGRRGRDEVAGKLLRSVGQDALRAVPGFGRERGRWTMANVEGLLIPVLNVAGRIVGIQVRTTSQRGKYRWLSTPSLEDGASSGGPAHVMLPDRGRNGLVWLTEGPLKADVVASRLKQCSVAVPGVGAWGRSIEDLEELQARTVVVAFDQDDEAGTAMVVGRHTRDLARVIRKKVGARVAVASWDVGKGIDDALVLGIRPRVRVLGR